MGRDWVETTNEVKPPQRDPPLRVELWLKDSESGEWVLAHQARIP